MGILSYWIWTVMIGGVGFLIGYFGSKMLSGKVTGKKGKIPSLRFKIRNYKIWFHHWFISFFSGLVILKYNYIFNTSQLWFLLGGCVGITLQGIKNYSDWKQIVVKE